MICIIISKLNTWTIMHYSILIRRFLRMLTHCSPTIAKRSQKKYQLHTHICICVYIYTQTKFCIINLYIINLYHQSINIIKLRMLTNQSCWSVPFFGALSALAKRLSELPEFEADADPWDRRAGAGSYGAGGAPWSHQKTWQKWEQSRIEPWKMMKNCDLTMKYDT